MGKYSHPRPTSARARARLRRSPRRAKRVGFMKLIVRGATGSRRN